MNCYVCNCFSKQAYTSIINPDWDFNKMGIGGLDNEFSAIFRRAFASRVFPPEVIEQLGKFKHIVNNDRSINIYICFLTKEIVSWWYYQHKYSGILKKNTCVKDWVTNCLIFTHNAMISGMKHVKGILLFGPPGTGKTLMARYKSSSLNI